MKKKLLGVLMLSFLLGSATACGSAQDTDVATSTEDVSKQDTVSSKDTLVDLGWKTETTLGLGFYLPDVGYDTDRHEKSEYYSAYTEYYIGYNSEYGASLLYVKLMELDDNTVISDTSIDFIADDAQYDEYSDIKMVRETEDLYVYEQTDDGCKYLYVFPKGTSIYYYLFISNGVFEEIDGLEFAEDVVYKKGELFTEETYNAFIDTLQYLGE